MSDHKHAQNSASSAVPQAAVTKVEAAPAPAVVKPAPLALAPKPMAASAATTTESERVYSVARIIHGMTKDKTNPTGDDFREGDLVLFPNKVKVADKKTSFGVIFLRNTLEWANFEVQPGKEEWDSEQPRNAANEDLPLEFTENGKKFKRYRQVTLFLLLPSQIDAFLKDAESENPSLEATVEPVAFKARNYNRSAVNKILKKCGDDLTQLNARRAQKGFAPIMPYNYQHFLKIATTTNDKGSFPSLEYVQTTAVVDQNAAPDAKAHQQAIFEVARDAYGIIAAKTNLKTAVVEEVQSSSSRGEVSDEV